MGLATGALYHYFATKEELLRAVCDQLMEPLLSQARVIWASPDDAMPASRSCASWSGCGSSTSSSTAITCWCSSRSGT